MTDQYSNIQNKGIFEGFDISNVLQTKTKEIGQSVSGFTNQTVNPIKSTVSDVKSGIALIKDTDRQLLNQLHTYRSETIESINNYLSNLTGGRFSLSDFGKVISIKDGFKVNSDELTRMASNAIGFNLSSIATIKNDLSNEFLKELNEMSLGLSNGLFQVDNGKITIAGDWDRKIGDAVFNFLSNGSDDFKTVKNFAAANAVLNVMVEKNAQIGFVNGFSSFEGMYLYESDYHAALIASIGTLLSKGDIDSLDEVLKILNSESIMMVRAIYPKFTETVLSKFTLPLNALVENYTTYGEKLITIIEKVNGGGWMNSTTFYGSVLNIGLVSVITDDSKTILAHYSQTLKNRADELEKQSQQAQAEVLRNKASSIILIITCGGFISIEKASDVFKRDFPNAVTF